MELELFTALVLPLLFSIAAGIYGFRRFPERRPTLLLNLICFQFVGAFALRAEPSIQLLSVMALHVLCVGILLAKHVQTPELVPVHVKR
ncbi:hypothetical protein D3875_07205 [Deinococcus cavernae]|uniref:Uncharacterized protein n=1 Tax=Deinococcus cavernae TaxID=2320857 RepID=A0A418V5Q2_9DEIO|nr:hypothetical protein [Deinococcus cavernae]RJF71389.1 hypothetical protein D3875_07205 [Deinococcus cavernae]